ncbi:MAG TPA: hypothetical protein VLF88_03990 [Candidatus Babeliales bacterium]|nr:hypothetical protein [Candidatus Babeliales bacterium]
MGPRRNSLPDTPRQRIIREVGAIAAEAGVSVSQYTFENDDTRINLRFFGGLIPVDLKQAGLSGNYKYGSRREDGKFERWNPNQLRKYLYDKSHPQKSS